MKQIYNLKYDSLRIKMVQESSLDKNSCTGYKTENGLLFGSEEWFNAIEKNIIPSYTVNGSIACVYMSGHNDYPEFEIQSGESKTTWTREGNDSAYIVGKSIELIYVHQKYKRPSEINGTISKCVIEIKIAE